MAYQLTSLEPPPAEMYYRRPRAPPESPEAMAAGADPRWGSALLSYLGEIDQAQKKRASLRGQGGVAEVQPGDAAGKGSGKESWKEWRARQKKK